MRLEFITSAAGVVILLLGGGIVWDACGSQTLGPLRERRRSERAGLDAIGELIAGLGIGLLGVSLVGREWRLQTAIVLVGTICIVTGALRNRKYFREVLFFRGTARRRSPSQPTKSGKLRIR